MAKKSGTAKQELQVMEFLRLGGKKLPAGFAGKVAASSKALRQRQLKAETTTRLQGEKLFSALKGASTVAVDDPANKKALDGLLSWHKKLAATRLAFPRPPGGIGGSLPGTISGTVVAPFDYADTIPSLLANVTNPTLAVSANVDGQISASAASAQALGFNGGGEFARVGIFFHPIVAGTLTVTTSPIYSFQWSTNSLNTTPVESSGTIGLAIYGMNDFGQILATAGGGTAESWQELNTGQVNFDFGFNLQKPLVASLPVTPSLVYLCFVSIDAFVFGEGWPGSLATAMASATVPSISYVFTPRLVLHP